jgi:hypothetical protein
MQKSLSTSLKFQIFLAILVNEIEKLYVLIYGIT